MRLAASIGAALAVLAALPASAQELRIGFLNTTSGSGAIIGRHLERGWQLGLEHQGWMKDGDKLGGVPTRIYTGDDQAKPDVGVREIDKMLLSERVHIVAGFLWSHVLIAGMKPLLDNKKIVISTVPGPSNLAGKECSPYFMSVLHQNDSAPEATGELINRNGFKTVFAMAPNYQAGRDMIAGLQRTYKGKIVDQLLFKLGETDFQAEISKVKALKPDAVFIFAPGPMGIGFIKQWVASGAARDIKVYNVFTVDWLTLPAIGNDAMGTFHVDYWSAGDPSETNQRFVKEYVARFNHHPSIFSVGAYDAARLIGTGVKAVNGKVEDTLALAKAMRRTPFPSVRPSFKFNVNGFPIQDHYTQEIVTGPDGKVTMKTLGVVVKEHKDAYWEQCPEAQRL
ncbi:MAG: ABC transporter substrate-binding protein [Alphaproteobacteria bacterium]